MAKFPCKLNIHRPYDHPTIPFLGILGNLKLTFTHTHTRLWQHYSYLPIIRNNSKCSLINEWISNLWYIYIVGTNQQEKGTIYWYTQQFGKSQIIMLSERHHFQNIICCMFPFIKHLQKDKTVVTENMLAVAGGYWHEMEWL